MDRGLDPLASLDPADGPKVMLETLAGILAFAGAEAMAQTFCETAPDRSTGVGTVGSLGEVDSPHAGTVLQALTQAGDKDVAKAARRALFRRRSRHELDLRA